MCTGFEYWHVPKKSNFTVPQPRNSTWRCMVCFDVCATCVPAAKILPGRAFLRAVTAEPAHISPMTPTPGMSLVLGNVIFVN